MTPSCHKNGCTSSVQVLLTPMIWPRWLMSTALLADPPRVPRSIIRPSSQRNAWLLTSAVVLRPTIWPRWLMALGIATGPPSVPRSVRLRIARAASGFRPGGAPPGPPAAATPRAGSERKMRPGRQRMIGNLIVRPRRRPGSRNPRRSRTANWRRGPDDGAILLAPPSPIQWQFPAFCAATRRQIRRLRPEHMILRALEAGSTVSSALAHPAYLVTARSEISAMVEM